MIRTNGIPKFSFQVGLIFGLGQVLVIISSWHFLPPKLPLFYSGPWGEEQLATPISLSIIPLISLAVLLVNIGIASLSTEEESLVSQILLIATSVFNFLGFVALVQIIRLVI